jgi:hypothetical protein
MHFSCKRLLQSGTCLAAAVLLTLPMIAPRPAMALSELKQEAPAPAAEQNAPDAPAAPAAPETEEQNETEPEAAAPEGIPMPDPLVNPSAATTAQTAGEVLENATIEYDFSKAPAPVKRLRELLIEAAKTGDIEKLRPLINQGPNQARIDGVEDESADPIAALKAFSGDAAGQEILAILLDLLSTGYAHIDAGTPEETYVFPYFAGKPLASLNAPERVELLRIITAGDLADMEEYGIYSFYRIGISPDGEWKFFTSGD